MSDKQDRLDESICLESRMPLRWNARQEPASDMELQGINQANSSLFQALAVIDESALPDLQDHGALGQELMRLDAKLNLILSMVGQLLSQQSDLPPPSELVLTASSLRLPGMEVPDGAGLAEVYLHPGIAMPLVLPVTFTGGSGLIHGLAADVQNALERYLFRQHRRAVATARHPFRPESKS